MRNLIALLFLFMSLTVAHGQGLRPQSISASYFGEMITHPGLKLGAHYSLSSWEKTRKNGVTVNKGIQVSPTIGFFYHRRYQTGLFVMPEIAYTRRNAKGHYFEVGAGFGYLRTFVPNTYQVSASGEVSKTSAGHNYFSGNLFLTFGKNLEPLTKLPMDVFLKPQWMYAVPNFPNSVSYFALELGLNYRLN